MAALNHWWLFTAVTQAYILKFFYLDISAFAIMFIKDQAGTMCKTFQ